MDQVLKCRLDLKIHPFFFFLSSLFFSCNNPTTNSTFFTSCSSTFSSLLQQPHLTPPSRSTLFSLLFFFFLLFSSLLLCSLFFSSFFYVDYAIDLSSMLSRDGLSTKQPTSSSSDNHSWAGFQCKCFSGLHITRLQGLMKKFSSIFSNNLFMLHAWSHHLLDHP